MVTERALYGCGGDPIDDDRADEEAKLAMNTNDRIAALEADLARVTKERDEALEQLSIAKSFESALSGLHAGDIETLKAELCEARSECERLRDVLLRHGFVVCDMPACNCGSWHHRYGLPERMQEIRGALTEAGVLDNSTGNLPLNAIRKLVEQRDAARKEET